MNFKIFYFNPKQCFKLSNGVEGNGLFLFAVGTSTLEEGKSLIQLKDQNNYESMASRDFHLQEARQNIAAHTKKNDPFIA